MLFIDRNNLLDGVNGDNGDVVKILTKASISAAKYLFPFIRKGLSLVCKETRAFVQGCIRVVAFRSAEQAHRGQRIYSALKQDQRNAVKRNSGVHQFRSLKSI